MKIPTQSLCRKIQDIDESSLVYLERAARQLVEQGFFADSYSALEYMLDLLEEEN